MLAQCTRAHPVPHAAVLSSISAACCLYKLFKVSHKSHSSLLHRSALTLLKFIAVQFSCSVPVLIALQYSGSDEAIEYDDNALGWHAFEAAAAGCEQLVATAQLLQVTSQIERLNNNDARREQSRWRSSDQSARGSSARASIGEMKLQLADAGEHRNLGSRGWEESVSSIARLAQWATKGIRVIKL